MRGGTLLALIQEKPTSIAGHGAEGERGERGEALMLEWAFVARGFIPVRLRSSRHSRKYALSIKCWGRCAAQRG